jgi:hypothetical protein
MFDAQDPAARSNCRAQARPLLPFGELTFQLGGIAALPGSGTPQPIVVFLRGRRASRSGLPGGKVLVQQRGVTDDETEKCIAKRGPGGHQALRRGVGGFDQNERKQCRGAEVNVVREPGRALLICRPAVHCSRRIR